MKSGNYFLATLTEKIISTLHYHCFLGTDNLKTFIFNKLKIDQPSFYIITYLAKWRGIIFSTVYSFSLFGLDFFVCNLKVFWSNWIKVALGWEDEQSCSKVLRVFRVVLGWLDEQSCSSVGFVRRGGDQTCKLLKVWSLNINGLIENFVNRH